MAQTEAEFMQANGLVQVPYGDDGTPTWIDPNEHDSDPRAKYDTLLRMYQMQNAKDAQGRSVWGSEGAPAYASGGLENKDAIVDIGGKKYYRQGDQGDGHGLPVTYDAKYGNLVPLDEYQAYQKEQQKKGNELGLGDALFAAVGGYGGLAAGAAAAAGGAAAGAGAGAGDVAGGVASSGGADAGAFGSSLGGDAGYFSGAGSTGAVSDAAWGDAISSFGTQGTVPSAYTTAGAATPSSFSSMDEITGLLTGGASDGVAASGDSIASSVANEATGTVPDAVQSTVSDAVADTAGNASHDVLDSGLDHLTDASHGVGATQSGGMISDAMNWAKQNPLLTSTATNLVSGILRGVAQPGIDKAKAQAEADARLRADQTNRLLTSPSGMQFKIKPTGNMLRTPGLIGNAMQTR